MQIFRNLRHFSFARAEEVKCLNAPSTYEARGYRFRRADPKLDYWVYQWPDPVTAMGHRLSVGPSSDLGSRVPYYFQQNISFFGSSDFTKFKIDLEAPPHVLCLDSNRYFVRCLLPLEIHGSAITSGVVFWAEISLHTAKAFIGDSSSPGFQQDVDGLTRFWGSVANLFKTSEKEAGLFSLARFEWNGSSTPVVVDASDVFSPFPGLANWLAENRVQSFIDEIESFEEKQNYAELIEVERSVAEGERISALFNWQAISSRWNWSARAQFLAGCLFQEVGDYLKSIKSFNLAAKLAHPVARSKELEVHSEYAAPFRKHFPDLFNKIKRGDRLQALTELRSAAVKFPLEASAVLAYCLRGSNCVEEGKRACERALSMLPEQSDVLGHLWSYLNELEQDQQALETAKLHISKYPEDPAGTTNFIDSNLLLGNVELAKLGAERYSILNPNVELTLRQYFKVYEQSMEWEPLAYLFDRIVPHISGPSAQTLVCYGEVLIEIERFDESLSLFERAMMLEPNNAQVVLGYARALARYDHELEAEQLLETVLSDKNRFDKMGDRSFLVTMLAEIQRRTGRPSIAIDTFNREFSGDLVQLSIEVGPMPALEYANSLIDLGDFSQAQQMLVVLQEKWPDDQFIQYALSGIQQ